MGGETAEHPGLLEPDEYDVAGAATGVVEYADVLGPHRVRAGDVVLGLASSAACTPTATPWCAASSAHAGWALDRHVDEFGRTLGEELLDPDPRLLRATCLDLVRTDGIDVHALRHVTGGGLAANLARVLPPGVLRPARPLHLDPAGRSSTVGATSAACPRADLERTLNMGVGFVAMLPADQADAATRDAGRARHPGLGHG